MHRGAGRAWDGPGCPTSIKFLHRPRSKSGSLPIPDLPARERASSRSCAPISSWGCPADGAPKPDSIEPCEMYPPNSWDLPPADKLRTTQLVFNNQDLLRGDVPGPGRPGPQPIIVREPANDFSVILTSRSDLCNKSQEREKK